MNKPPEALRLAEACENLLNHADNSEVVPQCAAELRRLHMVNSSLLKSLELIIIYHREAIEEDGGISSVVAARMAIKNAQEVA